MSSKKGDRGYPTGAETPPRMRRGDSVGQLQSLEGHMAHHAKTTDASIIAFASVRNNAATSEASFGDWNDEEAQIAQRIKHSECVVPTMIEVMRGSPNKYEVEKETGQLMLDRVLHSSVYYPGDYGYVPQTLCGDGDPLDILIVTLAESSAGGGGLDPGCMVNCRVVGLMDMEDESGHDEKVISVLANQKSTDHIKDLDDIPDHMRKEIKHFFENYKRLEIKKGKQKWAKVLGWGNCEMALKVVAESRATYAKKYGVGVGGKLHPFVSIAQCPNLLHVKQPLALGESDVMEATCYVNVAKGSLNSYVYRQDTTYRHYKYTLDMPYPGDYGWICQTWQRDSKKPIEILILSTFPLSPECLVDVRIVGALERSYKTPAGDAVTDVKAFGVLTQDPRTDHVKSITSLNQQALKHFSNFFIHSAEMASCSDCKIIRTIDAAETRTIITKAHEDYQTAFRDQRIHNAPNLWCLPWGSEATSGASCDRVYPAIIESSKHTFNKYCFDIDSGVLKCLGPLRTSAFWPGNMGFIPQTVAEDGKPVDVMVLSMLPLQSRCVTEMRIVGAAECIDEMGPDIKIIAVPKSEPRMKEWKDIDDVPKHMRDEIVHFNNGSKDLEDEWKFCRFERWMECEEATKYVQSAHSRFFLFVLPMQRLEKRLSDLETENKMLRRRSSQ